MLSAPHIGGGKLMLFVEREEGLGGGSVVITATSKHAPAFALRGPAYVWGGLGQLVFADIADDEDENKAVRIDGCIRRYSTASGERYDGELAGWGTPSNKHAALRRPWWGGGFVDGCGC